MSQILGAECVTLPSLETLTNGDLLERFQAARYKIAIQKGGTLTDFARNILYEDYGLSVPAAPKGRVPVEVSDDGEFGIIYARNKAICDLVVHGAVDRAIVGTDRLIEDEAEGKVEIVSSYGDKVEWPLVLAVPQTNRPYSLSDIRRVATQYPIITQRYFEAMGNNSVEIITTSGGTELYPYLLFSNTPIDAIVDLTSSGQTLNAHNMKVLETVGTVHPVLIQSSLQQN